MKADPPYFACEELLNESEIAHMKVKKEAKTGNVIGN